MQDTLFHFWRSQGWVDAGPGLVWTGKGAIVCKPYVLTLSSIYFDDGTATSQQLQQLVDKKLIPASLLPTPPPEPTETYLDRRIQKQEEQRAKRQEKERLEADRRQKQAEAKRTRLFMPPKPKRQQYVVRAPIKKALPIVAPAKDEEGFRVISAVARGRLLGQAVFDGEVWICTSYSGKYAAVGSAESAQEWLRIKCYPCSFLRTREKPRLASNKLF